MPTLLALHLATFLSQLSSILIRLGITVDGAGLLYALLFYGLRSLFRDFEKDIALVTLNVSGIPLLVIFILVSLKFTLRNVAFLAVSAWDERIIEAGIVLCVSYWLSQLFVEVIAYYLKEYAQQTEAMWDDVLIPLLEGVIPIVIYLVGGFFLLRSFGVDLTGIWVTLGGATFVIGFAVKDILANFFSGLVLLIDTPFQFGDVVRLENGSIAVLQKIGIRVTQLDLFDNHSEIYIPNSNLQSQNIVNLSRPTTGASQFFE